MNKWTSLVFILMGFVVNAQVRIDTTKYFDTYNYGSVKVVSEKPMLKISVFISDKNNDWSLSEKKRVLSLEKKALKWIANQAENYGLKELNIDHKNLFATDRDFEIEYYPKSKGYSIEQDTVSLRDSDVLNDIWNAVLDTNTPDKISSKELKSYSGGYFVLMHYKRFATAKASPDYSYGRASKLPEYIYFSNRNANGKKLTKQTIAHEILHLFGAWDFYYTNITLDKKTSDKIAKSYPNSIMLTGNKSLSSLTIDPITAWRIGLSETIEPWYLEIVPKYYHKSSYGLAP